MINGSLIQKPLTMFNCYSLEWFKQSRPLRKGQRSLKLGNKEYVSVMAVGLVELWLKTLRLPDHLFVSDLREIWFFVCFLWNMV